MAGRRQRRSFGNARITKGALWLLLASTALSFLYLLSNDELKSEMSRMLAASPHSVWNELKLWQLATSPLLETDFIGLIFQGFMLWMFLPGLERWWGTKRFLLFALYTSLAGVVVGTLVGLWVTTPVWITGLDPFIFAGIVAYGVLFANQPVQFFGVLPMTGRQLTIGIIAFMALFLILGGMWAEGAANVAAMALAWSMTSSHGSPKLWWLKWKQRRIRKKFKVVDGDRKGKPWIN